MTVYFKELGNYGQLGNCLFQMGATIGTACKYGDNFRFPYCNFQAHLNLSDWSRGGPHPHHIPTYEEPHFHFAPIPRMGTAMNLHGYFQSAKYFEGHEDKVAEILTPQFKFDHSEYASIHVRRTDYLIHTDCYSYLDRRNYYNKAMSILPNNKFLIFSDDLAWCKQEFTGNEFEFSEERDPLKDLAHMIGCNNHIIANSSFSWWGAWLDQKPKMVVAPRNWFGPKLAPTHNTKDLLPEGWIAV